MGTRNFVLALGLFSTGLVFGAWLHRQTTAAELNTLSANVALLSNSWSRAVFKPGDDHPGAGPLRITARELNAASNTLAAVDARLLTAADELKAFQAELERRQARLSQVEAQRNELSRKCDALASTLAARDREIGVARTRLATAEDDRDFLLKEYKRLHQATADIALGAGRKPATAK